MIQELGLLVYPDGDIAEVWRDEKGQISFFIPERYGYPRPQLKRPLLDL